MKGTIVLVVLGLVSLAAAHSWVQCVDYTEENGQFWDASKCRGWPRNYEQSFKFVNPPYVFGGDAGYNYQPTEGAPCKTKPATGDYTTTYPAAKYAPGQRVCMAWPPKNHVAAKCNNANIGDAGTKIFRSGLNPTTDPTLSQFEANLVYDFGTNTGTQGIGFQNCPDFCANPDKSLCTGCFNMPALPLGKYTFMWEWAFNGPNDKYSNCFDVEIVASTPNTITSTCTRTTPDDFKTQGAAGTPCKGGAVAPSPAAGGGDADNTKDGGSGSAKKGSSGGMSEGGKAALAIFFIALFVVAVMGVLYKKNGQLFGYKYDDGKIQKVDNSYSYNAARN